MAFKTWLPFTVLFLLKLNLESMILIIVAEACVKWWAAAYLSTNQKVKQYSSPLKGWSFTQTFHAMPASLCTIEFSIFECLYFLVISVFLSSEIFVLTWLPTRNMTNRFSIPYLCNSFVTVTHDFNSSWKERTLDVTIWGSESVHTKCIC